MGTVDGVVAFRSAGLPTGAGAREGDHRPGTVRSLVRGARPAQWSKNVLVFMAPAAAGVLHEPSKDLAAAATFVAFCLAASGCYFLNDVLDADNDRRHPAKRRRPVAAGELSVRLALAAAGVGMVAGVTVASLAGGWRLALVVGGYLAVTAAYSLGVKRIAVLEMGAVAAGFVLRAVAGGVATGVPLSNWFLVVTSFGALFLIVGKRTAEHRELGTDAGSHRVALEGYTQSFLRSALTLTASVTVTAYCLWAFDRHGLVSRAGHRGALISLTVVPVVLGVLYVLQLLDAGKGGAPERLMLRDRVLHGLGVLWVALLAAALYG